MVLLVSLLFGRELCFCVCFVVLLLRYLFVRRFWVSGVKVMVLRFDCLRVLVRLFLI